MIEWTFRTTTPADWPQIADLLAAAHLPLKGAENHLSGFLLVSPGRSSGPASARNWSAGCSIRAMPTA